MSEYHALKNVILGLEYEVDMEGMCQLAHVRQGAIEYKKHVIAELKMSLARMLNRRRFYIVSSNEVVEVCETYKEAEEKALEYARNRVVQVIAGEMFPVVSKVVRSLEVPYDLAMEHIE